MLRVFAEPQSKQKFTDFIMSFREPEDRRWKKNQKEPNMLRESDVILQGEWRERDERMNSYLKHKKNQYEN